MLTKTDKKDISKIVIDAINDVVVPAFELVYKKFEEIDEKMATKIDLEKVEIRLEKVETRLDIVEHKLDRVVDNQIEDKGKFSDHEKRLRKLEQTVVAS